MKDAELKKLASKYYRTETRISKVLKSADRVM